MKKKTINTVIVKKINNWIESIDDRSLRIRIKNDIIVTGGCITSMLLNEEINDFDVYFKTKESLKAISQYYTNKFNENNKGKSNKSGRPFCAWVLDGEDIQAWKEDKKQLSDFAYDYQNLKYNNAYMRVSGMLLNTPPDRIKIMVNSDGIAEDSDAVADAAEYDINEYLEALGDGDNISSDELNKTEKYKPVFLSTNAITLSDKIQVVVRFYGKPEEIHENYDFVHVTNYWTFQTGVVLKQEALEAIMNKELVYVGSKYPICSLVRTRKFIKRGWQINAGQYVKMSFQISKLDLEDTYVLEDQLIGVDSVYFLHFINTLKKKQLTDKSFVLTQDYLTTVIDKIFG